MKIFFTALLLFSTLALHAKVSFFALNLSGETKNCVLRSENCKIQPWGVEDWKNEETILLDNNLTAGEYFIWTKDNDTWKNTNQQIVLEDEKLYCLQALTDDVFKLEEFSFITDKKNTAGFAVINQSGYELNDVKFATDFEKKPANYFDCENINATFFPVKTGNWKLFWEYKDFPDSYFALQNNNDSPAKNKKSQPLRKITVEPTHVYLLILLPEQADFMQLGTFTFPYK